MQKSTHDIVIFLVVVSLLTLVMITFIITILYLYRKRQISFEKDTQELIADYEKNLLFTKLEIQEDTFKDISREIHDNISLSLTLAKLNLRTLDVDDKERSIKLVNSSIELLQQSINDLNDISRGLNSDLIIQNGLLKALEDEIQHIQQTGLFTIYFGISGCSVYMDAQKELIIFRIIQEAFNNIIKHAKAKKVELMLHYNESTLDISINDNGHGFDTNQNIGNKHAGLKNMETRIKMLKGSMHIKSIQGLGTSLSFTLPID